MIIMLQYPKASMLQLNDMVIQVKQAQNER